MGIKGYTTFLKQRFDGWQPVDFEKWSHLVIDGNSVCYTLYRKHFSWLLGGEYHEFENLIKKFFKVLQDAGSKNPIVVFDGVGFDVKKFSTTWDRRVTAMKGMQKVQVKNEWSLTGVSNSGVSLLPLMLINVFMDVLRSLKIEICIADGEGDNKAAALANEHKCPVLASDSDYSMFKLEYGFIHFERYYYENRNNSLFELSVFMKEFKLKTYEQCLLIPTAFGNDFIKSNESYYPEDFKLLLENIAKYDSHQEFLDEACHGTITREKFETAKKTYNLGIPADLRVSAASTAEVPKWVLDKIKEGRFPGYLLTVHDTKYFMPRVVEVIEKDSAWQSSQYIRQYLYGLIGVREGAHVTEIIRDDFFPRLVEESVSPKFLRVPITIRDPLFTDACRDEEKLQDLVLAILKCHNIPEDDIQHIFNPLDSMWKLPIATTHYWYRHIKSIPRAQPRDLLKSLLLSFFTCRGIISNPPPPPLSRVTAGTRSDHLTALHAFSQWQCVYYNAIGLNYLAKEPFPSTSPACLYSGKVAMHYATNCSHEGNWLTSIIPRGSKEWELVNKFLCLVTGHGEDSSANGWTKV